MLRKTIQGLCLTGALLSLNSHAALPDNIQLQRDTLRTLTMTLQGQAEGLPQSQRTRLRHSIEQLEITLATDYPRALRSALSALDNHRALTSEEMDLLYQSAIESLASLHQPAADTFYMSLLMTEYLTMRYAFNSYVGIPSDNSLTASRYYTANVTELLRLLDREMTKQLANNTVTGLTARWAMLHHAFSDMHEGWTRTRSGNPFAPIVVILNANTLSDQLSDMLDAPVSASQ